MSHQVVESDETVGFASPESGLGLDHRVSTKAVQPLDRAEKCSNPRITSPAAYLTPFLFPGLRPLKAEIGGAKIL